MRRQVDLKRIDTFGPEKHIVPRLADIQWAERVRPRADTAQAPAAIAPAGTTASLLDQPPAAAPADPDEATPKGESYQEATRTKAWAEARSALVKAKRDEGTVYDKERVDQGVADAFRKLSDRVFAVTRRAAIATAGLVEPREIETIFEDELRKAFGEWERSIRPQMAERISA